MTVDLCAHLEDLTVTEPGTPEGCEECLAVGDQWVHLRLCMACGHVGCCDSSKNRHASRHYSSTDHQVIQSFQPGENWAWCFPDELVLPEVEPELARP